MHENISLKLEESFPQYDEKTDKNIKKVSGRHELCIAANLSTVNLIRIKMRFKVSGENVTLEQWDRTKS